MKLLPINELQIADNRQRREFDESLLSELAEDIASRGLFHAIVRRETPEGPFLVAGERRVRAISALHEFAIPVHFDGRAVPIDCVPTVTLGELSELDAREAELSENICRADLTWQEKAQAIADLHEIGSTRQAELGLQQTFQQTAEILPEWLEANRTVVRESVVIRKHMADPDVAKAATPKEALKVIEKKLVHAHNETLAKEMGKIAVAERHTLIQGDALQELAKTAEGTFDVILSDPPYGIDAQNFGTQAQNTHAYDDGFQKWTDTMAAFAHLAYAACKNQAHAYVFCDPDRFNDLKTLMEKASWSVWRTPLIWTKTTGMLPRPEHGPRRQYEFILFANKGDRRTTAVYSDVLPVPSEHTTLHPAQKPVALYTNLLTRSCRPGDRVCDPFCGSGTIFPAANRLALHAVGIEIAPGACGEALKRMEEK